MFGTIPVGWINILSSLAISLVMIGGAVLAFKFMWMDNYDFFFPKGKLGLTEAIIRSRRSKTMKKRSFRQVL